MNISGINSSHNADFSSLPKKITDAAIIAEIINPANWDINGEYIGSTAGLLEGNYHNDSVNKTRYEFTDSLLVRTAINIIV